MKIAQPARPGLVVDGDVLESRVEGLEGIRNHVVATAGLTVDASGTGTEQS